MALETFFASTAGIVVIYLLAIWQIPWKAVALWKAARRKDTVWFIVMLLVNLAAILEIIYIFAVAKKKKER
jgi:biotin transporter BioY